MGLAKSVKTCAGRKMNSEQLKEFEEVCALLIVYLKERFPHPYMTAVVTVDGAELLEGKVRVNVAKTEDDECPQP